MVFSGAALPAAHCCLKVGPLGPADGPPRGPNWGVVHRTAAEGRMEEMVAEARAKAAREAARAVEVAVVAVEATAVVKG